MYILLFTYYLLLLADVITLQCTFVWYFNLGIFVCYYLAYSCFLCALWIWLKKTYFYELNKLCLKHPNLRNFNDKSKTHTKQLCSNLIMRNAQGTFCAYITSLWRARALTPSSLCGCSRLSDWWNLKISTRDSLGDEATQINTAAELKTI